MPTDEIWRLRGKAEKRAYSRRHLELYKGRMQGIMSSEFSGFSAGTYTNLYGTVKALTMQMATSALFDIRISHSTATALSRAYDIFNRYNSLNGLLFNIPNQFRTQKSFIEIGQTDQRSSPFPCMNRLNTQFNASLVLMRQFGEYVVTNAGDSSIIDEMKEAGLNNDELIAEATVQIGGAHGAPAAYIANAITVLAENENVAYQAHLTEEPEQFRYSLMEAARLYPPFWMQLRQSQQEVVLGDITLPPFSDVFFCAYAAERDTKVYGEDANEFRPGRFISDRSLAAQLTTFGFGERRCPGNQIGIIMAQELGRSLFEKFNISNNVPPSFQFIDTLRPSPGNTFTLSER